MIIWKNSFPDFNHTAIFCRLNCGHPGVFSWYSPWCSTRMVERLQVWLEAEEKNGAKDSPSICPGVEGRPAISKNVGAKSMFITCSCDLINIVINTHVVNSFFSLYQLSSHKQKVGWSAKFDWFLSILTKYCICIKHAWINRFDWFPSITMHCPNEQSSLPFKFF